MIFFKRCDDVIVGVRLCQFICFLLFSLSLGSRDDFCNRVAAAVVCCILALRVDLAKRDCRLLWWRVVRLGEAIQTSAP